MNYEMMWKALNEEIVKNEFYTSEDGDLQYLLGFIDGLKKAMEMEAHGTK